MVMQMKAQGQARHWMRGILLTVGLLVATATMAQRVEGDRAIAQNEYEAEVSVRNQNESDRDNALARALVQTLSKVTGDSDVAQRPGVREELRKAKDYVDGFDYRQDERVSATGAPNFQTVLVVRFKQDAVDDLIAMLGLPSWSQPRPKPVLWMGVDDGSGPRLVGLGQVNAARSILDQAKSRGYALGLPEGTAAEQAAIGAIWRGDTAAIANLSKRYRPAIQLIGKVQRTAGGWAAAWTLVDNGKVLSSWQTTHTDARRAIASGADGVVDAMFKRYAKASTSGTPGVYRVRVHGVRNTDDYLRLIGYWEGVSTIKRVMPVAATADALDVDLDLAIGLPGFLKYVERTGVLQLQSNGEEAARVTLFRLNGA